MKNISFRSVFLHSIFSIVGFAFSLTTQAYDYTDDQPYSQTPPHGLNPNQVPMFVSIGFDDNGVSGLEGSGGTGGLTWFLNYMRTKKNPAGTGNLLTYDSTPARVTFFNTSSYQEEWKSDDPVYIKRAWHTAMTAGHEIGNHTVDHSHGSNFTLTQWLAEIGNTQVFLSKPFDPNEQPGNSSSTSGMGADIAQLTGFRTPFLEYNDATFKALKQKGLTYDTSIEEGWHHLLDGTNYPWPYTLNSGSPGNQSMVDDGFPNKTPISSHAGLWELGVTPLIIPPDNITADYGIDSSIRDKVKINMPWFDLAGGKITAFDWNIWAQAKLNKAETLATLKYTLDLRLQNGNRAPFMLGAHIGNFSSKKADLANQISVRERQEVLEAFITYALSKPDVRIVPFNSIINWMRNPSPLDCGTSCEPTTTPDITPQDPWEAIVSLGAAINDLQEYSDTLPLTYFAGNTWQEQLSSKDQISIDLLAAANDCWNGKPDLAIIKLNLVLSYLDQKMLAGSEQTSNKQKIHGYLPQLATLVGATF
ncbi:MAG: polysaccharide deacetylase family protein [Methylococcales bacterium]